MTNWNNTMPSEFLKLYKCHKIVHAEPMTAYQFYHQSDKAMPEHLKTNVAQAGYHVIYSMGTPDEYHSWQPKKAFDDGYTEIGE